MGIRRPAIPGDRRKGHAGRPTRHRVPPDRAGKWMGTHSRPVSYSIAGGGSTRFPPGRCACPLQFAGVASDSGYVALQPALDGPARGLRSCGSGVEQSRIVCCFLGCDETPFNPLLAALPRVMHLSGSGDQAKTGWLGTLLNIATSESGRTRAGGENVLARLSELVFVEAIRRYLETLPADQTGWLAGLRDPMVGRALAALHSDASKQWTVEGLARLAGLSRSVFAERFTAMVGHPPMQYLALWRMQLAARLLADGGGVAAVAGAVGYESEAAFSRAFKKLVGQAPGTWRRQSGPLQEAQPG